jgi:hypothetical protein
MPVWAVATIVTRAAMTVAITIVSLGSSDASVRADDPRAAEVHERFTAGIPACHCVVMRSRSTAFNVAMAVLVLTVAQLAVGALAGLDQYAGKGFGYRLIFYPFLMLLVPVVWWWRTRAEPIPSLPWDAFALIMAPFLIDVSGNTLDLYDSFEPWDNINHFVNWLLLLWGCGLLIARADVRPRWLLVFGITGLGAILAVGWELGEWYTFIRRGTELDGAYEDTLSDELLGTLGAFVGALIVQRTTSSSASPRAVAQPPVDAGGGV